MLFKTVIMMSNWWPDPMLSLIHDKKETPLTTVDYLVESMLFVNKNMIEHVLFYANPNIFAICEISDIGHI